MLCWHFTLAVCCKSHQYHSAPTETFSKKNENKLLALDQTVTSAAQIGESKIRTPCCCFESFQKLLQAGKLFYFNKTFSELPGWGCLPVHAAVWASWQVQADSLGSHRPACTAAILSPKQQQVLWGLWGKHFRNHLFICLLPICSPFPSSILLTCTLFHQRYSPSRLHFPAPSYPQLLHNLLTCWSEGKSAWRGKLQSETLLLIAIFQSRTSF